MTTEPTNEALAELLDEIADEVFDRDRFYGDACRLAASRLRSEEVEQGLKSAESWLERWAQHVGDCAGGMSCTCGLTRIRFDVAQALGLAAGKEG